TARLGHHRSGITKAGIMASWAQIGGKLSVALLQKFENSDSIREMCCEVRITNMDQHIIFSQIGERLGLVPEETVAAAFANIWAQAYPDEVQRLLRPVRAILKNEALQA
ncbi:hypothetical protein, partial [Rhodovulum sp. PH10]|uniref:hypothetical protein n=1 Tax=Rhodovulum sp. PH10 TaxID=1187851 RepID=UPI001ED8D012